MDLRLGYCSCQWNDELKQEGELTWKNMKDTGLSNREIKNYLSWKQSRLISEVWEVLEQFDMTFLVNIFLPIFHFFPTIAYCLSSTMTIFINITQPMILILISSTQVSCRASCKISPAPLGLSLNHCIGTVLYCCSYLGNLWGSSKMRVGKPFLNSNT